MGGTGRQLDDCAREIYDEWAACQHFFLYDDVPPVLQELAARGLKIGLISNSHRCLASFQQHFELQGLITAAVSSSEHGYMKPHPSIFEAALTLAGVEAQRVGDGRATAWRTTSTARGASACAACWCIARTIRRRRPMCPVIRSMTELPELALDGCLTAAETSELIAEDLCASVPL